MPKCPRISVKPCGNRSKKKRTQELTRKTQEGAQTAKG
uniref:Uncharacterized protein n=1 Tax=Rhizophora mucronata TaxID=61149 RepID=A0A2P2M8S1_RHIMU